MLGVEFISVVRSPLPPSCLLLFASQGLSIPQVSPLPSRPHLQASVMDVTYLT